AGSAAARNGAAACLGDGLEGGLLRVGAADLAQHAQHLLHGRGARIALPRHGPQPANRLLAPNRPQHHSRVPARQLGKDRDAEAAGDKALDHLVVLALEGDVRLEAGFAAEVDDLEPAGAGHGAAVPVLLLEVGETYGLGGGEWMADRQSDPHRLLEDQLGLDVAGELKRELRIVEDDRNVEVAALHPRIGVLRVRLAELELDLREAVPV